MSTDVAAAKASGPTTDDDARAKRCDLVCEGGGVKGIGLAGAYEVLEHAGFEPMSVAGTSAGAITAAAIAAGYSAAELKELVMSMDYNAFMDKGWEDRLPAFEKTLSIVKDHGIYEGDYFLEWMRALLAKKDVHTFGDLRHKPRTDGAENEFEHRLQVIVSDVTTHEMLVLPRDADKLGFEPDELEVALAVRMSMSIPIFFEPVTVMNERHNREHVLVDGGMLSNYPVWLFDCHGREPKWPTFGLLLVEPDPKKPVGERLEKPELARRGALGLVPFLKSLAQTMMQAHDRMYVEEANWARTIGIPTLGVGTTEFDLPHDRALELYESGRGAAQKFLDRWSFEGYLAEFRSGKEHSRTDKIAEQIREATPA